MAISLKNSTSTITVGKLTMSIPAFVTAVAGIVNGIIIILILPQFWFVGLLMTAGFFVAAYNVNCAIVGKCEFWAWLLTFVYVIYALMVIWVSVATRKTMPGAAFGMRPAPPQNSRASMLDHMRPAALKKKVKSLRRK